MVRADEADTLIIECPDCKAKYQYDEARFEGKASKKIRCAKCQKIFEANNPAFAEPVAQAAPQPKPAATEATMTRREKKPEVHVEESTASAPIPGSSTDRFEGAPKLPAGRRLSLAIIDGPDAGKVFRIEKPRVVIGRSSADLVLNDIESSRAHAAVEVRDLLVILEDLGSTNGTLVDGERIAGMVELSNQGEFQIGSTTLMLIVTEE